MDAGQLIHRLNWFYSLELSQVDLYSAQSKQADGVYIPQVLERVAAIEQQHVDNIAAKIEELGGKPTVLGDVLAPITGKIAGTVTGSLGTIALLKTDIFLENEAMREYRDLILKVGDPDLLHLLRSNLIDEDLHTAWFADTVRELVVLEKTSEP